jgi:hypothetical protein
MHTNYAKKSRPFTQRDSRVIAASSEAIFAQAVTTAHRCRHQRPYSRQTNQPQAAINDHRSPLPAQTAKSN